MAGALGNCTCKSILKCAAFPVWPGVQLILTCIPVRAGEWENKVQRYVRLETIQIRPNPLKAGSQTVAVEAEGQKVLKQLKTQVLRDNMLSVLPCDLPCGRCSWHLHLQLGISVA